jgi:hypothetical protein
MNNQINTELTFTEIHEGSASIIFDPPLKVDAYLIKDDDGDKVNINFDFGLSHDFGLHPFYIQDKNLPWEKRVVKIVEFELFHSFFHPSVDPNYSILNWALFGNLAHRVTCVEKRDIFDSVCIETESWTYDRELKAVFSDSHWKNNLG